MQQRQRTQRLRFRAFRRRRRPRVTGTLAQIIAHVAYLIGGNIEIRRMLDLIHSSMVIYIL